jgi:pantoate--beta-alanine ligase
METFTSPQELRRALDAARRKGRSIALVPTMGSLHEGHLSLVHRAANEADLVVVSIFVNPTQFGPGEDFDAYPRDLDRDLEQCERAGVDMVFAPGVDVMYPQGASTSVEETALSTVLCGASRPGHFRGVATVVAALLNMVAPDVAVFGQKDAQQCCVIERMVRDLAMPVRIVRAPIVREPDGLAMSSRNRYLSADQREQATCLYRALCAAEEAVAGGERRTEHLGNLMRTILEREPDVAIDYVALVDAVTLEPREDVGGDPVLVALAVRVGSARLIDNLEL